MDRANWIAAGALLVSVIAIVQSYSALDQARTLTYQSHVAELKSSAMKEYVTLFGNYLAQNDLTNAKINVNINSPAVVRNLSDKELEEITIQAANSLYYYRIYSTSVNASTPQWPTAIRTQINETSDVANKWSRCYVALGFDSNPKNADYYSFKRQEIAKNCELEESDRRLFDTKSKQVINAMFNDIRKAWTEEVPE